MAGYIKHFDDDGKNKSFKIEDDNILIKYDEIWNQVLKMLKIIFHSQPICDRKYTKLK